MKKLNKLLFILTILSANNIAYALADQESSIQDNVIIAQSENYVERFGYTCTSQIKNQCAFECSASLNHKLKNRICNRDCVAEKAQDSKCATTDN